MSDFKHLPNNLKPKYENVVVIGKFMPMHKGHEFLFGFAKAHAKNVFVLVDNTPKDTIDVITRAEIIKLSHRELNVGYFQNKMPQDPSETPDFWKIWSSGMQEQVNKVAGAHVKINAVVASMDYGKELAKSLNCEFLPLDVERSTLSISATEIRNNPQKYFHYMSDAFKPHFVEKFAFIGAESTGKTTIINKLISNYPIMENAITAMVPEYAYQYLKTFDGEFTPECVPLFITAQEAQMNLAAHTSNGVLFCDSNALTTKVYAQSIFPHMYEDFPQELEEYVQKQDFKMIFLFKPDQHTPFVEDIHRNVFQKEEREKARLAIFERMQEELIKNNKPFLLISGTYENRLNIIKNYLDIYFKK